MKFVGFNIIITWSICNKITPKRSHPKKVTIKSEIRCCLCVESVIYIVLSFYAKVDHRADSRFAPSQWETALLCNDISHWLGTSLESALDDVMMRLDFINHNFNQQQWSEIENINFLLNITFYMRICAFCLTSWHQNIFLVQMISWQGNVTLISWRATNGELWWFFISQNKLLN